MQGRPLTERLAGRLAEGSGQPASHLIVEEVWLAVVDGSLATGERLPTARQLAITLGVSPRSVERAYDELERRGVTVTRTGHGTFVSLAPPSDEARSRHRRFAELCREAVAGTEALGFTVDDLLDALAEFRSVGRDPLTKDGGP